MTNADSDQILEPSTGPDPKEDHMSTPDWMRPGAQVAILYDNYSTQQLTYTTIDRVLKRDVVLDNGERFRIDNPSRRRGNTWDGTDTLLPRDHDDVKRAERTIAFGRARNGLRSLLSGYEQRARNAKNMDELRTLIDDLARDLNDRNTTPA